MSRQIPICRDNTVCVATSRVYVQMSIAEEFIKQYTQKMRAAPENIEDPQDPNMTYGFG